MKLLLLLSFTVMIYFYNLQRIYINTGYVSKSETIFSELETKSGYHEVLEEKEKNSQTSILFQDYWYREKMEENEASTLPPPHQWLRNNQTKSKDGDRKKFLREQEYNYNHLANISSTNSSNHSSIPKIIHKIFLQKEGTLPTLQEMRQNPSLVEAHNSWMLQNPGYTIKYYSLHLCREYLANFFHPVFLRVFDCIEAFAGKTNFFRMAVIYREGGWYSDWKQVCVTNNILDSLSNNDLILFRDLSANCMQNALIGSKPQNPLIRHQLSLVMHNVKNSFYGMHALYNTGTCVFGRAYREARNLGYLEDQSIEIGTFNNDHYFVLHDTKVALHKCLKCDSGQDWKNGNNYNTLHTQRSYYCQDSKAIYEIPETIENYMIKK